jgi:hypothetical protein
VLGGHEGDLHALGGAGAIFLARNALMSLLTTSAAFLAAATRTMVIAMAVGPLRAD